MSSNSSANPSKRFNKNNRPSMPMSSNVHNNQKPINRNMIRNSSNGQMTPPNNQVVPPAPIQNNITKYPNSNNSPNNSLDDIGTPNGVYKNGRLMHTVTSLIGCVVEVQLANGERYEGVLKTFSPEFDLVLFSAVKILNSNTDVNADNSSTNVNNLMSCLESKSEIIDKMVVPQEKMVKIKALSVDLEYATSKKSVLTDSEISKADGKKAQMKELVPWEDDGGNNAFEGLDENGISANGWDSNAMFDYNEKTYNIASTYTENMSGYTIQLNQRSDDDYRKKEAEAERIAREIEKDPGRQNRIAKENDVLDEETRFSAVVTKRDDANLSSSSLRSEISHSSRDDRRNPNNNDGFTRVQTGRRRGGGNRSSALNDSNWRDTARDGRLGNASRYESNRNPSQPSSSYNSNNNFTNAKPANPPGAYAPAKYPPPANNVTLNQYNQPSGPKSSYSAVSQRQISSDSLTSETDAKSLPPNRGHGNKSEHYPNEDSYSRRSASGLSQNQRDNFNKQRNSTSRSGEHDSPKSSNNQLSVSTKSEPDSSKTSLSTNSTPPTNSASALSTSANESFEFSGSSHQKAASPAKTESGNNQQMLHKNKSIDENQLNVTSKSVDSKKSEQPSSQTPPSTISSSEALKADEDSKIDSPPVSLSPVPTQSSPNISGDGSVNPPANSSNEVVKSSLNPNAKSFTPRVSAQPFIPQTMVQNYQYPAQHMSTTPPTVTAMPNQYIQMSQVIPPQHHHPHPQVHQQQTHPQMTRNNFMQFQPYNTIITPQMAPQYMGHMTMGPMPPNGMPHTVYSGPVPTGVPTPTAPQNTGPNQAGAQLLVQGGEVLLAKQPHHLLPNAAIPQGVPNQGQQPQGPSSRGPYRGGNKGGAGHNSGPNQVSQPYGLRQAHHDYNQQTQVANVTGQPIMASAQQPGHQIPIYSTAGPVHAQHGHHHHNQTQPHGQPPNLAGQMAPQPSQSMPFMHYGHFARPMSLIPQGHPQAMNQQLNMAGPMQANGNIMYDPNLPMMMCGECPPSMVPPQPIQTAVPQQNPNMQSAPNISSASSNPPNANQVS